MSRPQTPPPAYHMRVSVISILVGSCCLASFVGCDQLSRNDVKQPEPSTAQATQAQAGQISYQRFLPIAPPTGGGVPTIVPWHGFFALDTKTGMLCKTASHDFPSQAEWANQLPLCVGLIAAADRPNDSRVKSELEKELDKELDKDFGPPKTAEEYLKRHEKEAKTKLNDSNK